MGVRRQEQSAPLRQPRWDRACPVARLVRILDGLELEDDEQVIRILDAAEHALHAGLLAGTRPVLVEHRPPGS